MEKNSKKDEWEMFNHFSYEKVFATFNTTFKTQADPIRTE